MLSTVVFSSVSQIDVDTPLLTNFNINTIERRDPMEKTMWQDHTLGRTCPAACCMAVVLSVGRRGPYENTLKELQVVQYILGGVHDWRCRDKVGRMGELQAQEVSKMKDRIHSFGFSMRLMTFLANSKVIRSRCKTPPRQASRRSGLGTR